MYRVELDSGLLNGELGVKASIEENGCPYMQTEELTEDNFQPEADASHVCFERCEDIKCSNLGDVVIEGQGRILDITATIRNVCPGKRVAVGITVSEMDCNHTAHPRGTKVIMLPPHTRSTCKDMIIPCTRFILPEEAAVNPCSSICNNRRHFVVCIDANYVDTNGCCCRMD